jgi:photosystem II stability/assembly factor-like uncharacterized protein
MKAVLILGTTMAGLAMSAVWTEVDAGLPRTQVGARILLVNPSYPSKVYAVSSGLPNGWGSLFKSTNGGGTWELVKSISGVLTLVIDPRDSSKLYAIVRGRVLKSTDEGLTWTSTSGELGSAWALAIDPRESSTLYTLAMGGIFKTTDAGASWSRKPTPSTLVYGDQILIDPSDPATIYVISDAGLLKSIDGGENWSAPLPLAGLPGSARLLAIDPAHPSTIYITNIASAGHWSIFKSMDGGATWIPSNSGLASDAYVTSMLIDPGSETIYASYIVGDPTGGIAKSTDGGTSWTPVNGGLPSSIPPIYSLALASAKPATLLAGYMDVYGGRGGVYKSTDGATSWNETRGMAVVDVHAFAIDPRDRGTLYATVSDELAKSSRGTDWTTLFRFPSSSLGSTLISSFLIDPNDPKTLYTAVQGSAGCFQDGRWLRKTTDQGASWSALAPGGWCGFGAGLAFGANDSNTIYAGAQDPDDCGAPLGTTSDAGATWSTSLVDAWLGTLVSTPGQPAALFAASGRGVIKSTDGGRNWSNTGLTAGHVGVLAVDTRNPNILYAGVDQDWFGGAVLGFFRTTDGGATWSMFGDGLADVIATGTLFSALAIDPERSILYLGTSGSGVFSSMDGGAHWVPFNDGLPNLDIRALAVNGDGTVYAGTLGGVFRTVNKQGAPRR